MGAAAQEAEVVGEWLQVRERQTCAEQGRKYGGKESDDGGRRRKEMGFTSAQPGVVVSNIKKEGAAALLVQGEQAWQAQGRGIQQSGAVESIGWY